MSGAIQPAMVIATKRAATPLIDGMVVTTPMKSLQTDYTIEIGADSLHTAGTTGKGVTIAVFDTGLPNDSSQNYQSRVLATIDIRRGGSAPVTIDPYGHGTHITSIAAGGLRNTAGGYFGVAPQANLVIVRAFDDVGRKLHGRHRSTQLDRGQQDKIQHPGAQSIIRRAAAIELG